MNKNLGLPIKYSKFNIILGWYIIPFYTLASIFLSHDQPVLAHFDALISSCMVSSQPGEILPFTQEIFSMSGDFFSVVPTGSVGVAVGM